MGDLYCRVVHCRRMPGSVDDCFTGFLQARKSTSLWECTEDSSQVVASLNDVPRSMRRLEHLHHSKMADVYSGSWCVNIQIVKRGSRYDALVDGMKAPLLIGETADNEEDDAEGGEDGEGNDDDYRNRIFLVHTHRGMLQEMESLKKSVLSPCCVSVCVEDGESMPTRCMVQIWQSVTSIDGVTTRSRTLLGERQVSPHSSSDISGDVVMAPFPTVYTRQGLVAIYDMERVYSQRIKATQSVLFEALGSLGDLFKELLKTPSRSWYDAVFTKNTTASEADVLSAVSMGALLSAFALAAALVGFAPFGTALTTVTSTIAANPASVGFSAFAGQLFNNLKTWLRSPAVPEPRRITFTFSEFADTLESLAELVGAPNDEFTIATKIKKFQRELLVFKWLIEDEGESNPYGTDDDSNVSRGLFKPNPIDLTELKANRSMSVSSSIEINIEDSDICGSTIRTAFVAAMDDDENISSVASGYIQNMERIRSAIRKLSVNIESAITHLGGEGWFGEKTFWFVTWFVKPIVNTLKAAVSIVGKSETIKTVGIRSRLILVKVRNGIRRKLENKFMNTLSKFDRYRLALITTSNTLFRRPPEEIPDRANLDTRCIWVRHMPTAIRNTNTLFPAARGADINYVEIQNDDTASIIRQQSPVSDSIRVYNEIMRNYSHILSAMKSELNPIVFVHAFSAPITSAFGMALKGIRVFNILSIDQPLQIDIDSDATNMSESLRIRTRLLSQEGATGLETKSSLEHAGIQDTHQSLRAVTAVAHLFCEEVLALNTTYADEDVKHDMSLSMGNIVLSTLERTSEAGALIDAHTKSDTKSLLLSNTKQFLGTRAGRDVLAMLNTTYLSSLDNRNAVRWLRSFSSGLRNTVRSIQSRMQTLVSRGSSPVEAFACIPNESLQSLFMAKESCLYSHLRIANSMELLGMKTQSWGVFCAWAVASSYASSILQEYDAHATALPKLSVAQRNPYYCSMAMRRLASLRVDVDTALTYQYDRSSIHLGVEDVTAELSALDLASLPATFIVPFAYGEHMPRVGVPVAPPSLFGSVPVWCDNVRKALGHIKRLVVDDNTGVPGRSNTDLRVAFKSCLFENNKYSSTLQTPYAINVSAPLAPKDITVVATVFGALLPTHGLSPPKSDGVVEWPPTTKNASEVYDDRTAPLRQYAAKLNEIVSVTAWNADRIVQGILSLHSACGDSNRTIRLQLLGIDEDCLDDTEIDDDEVVAKDLPDHVLDEGRDTVVQAESFYEQLREFSKNVEGIALEKFQDDVDSVVFLAGPMSILPGDKFVERVLSNDSIGNMSDVLDFAKNAVALKDRFVSNLPSSTKWAKNFKGSQNAKQKYFDDAEETDEYQRIKQSLDKAAAGLEARVLLWFALRRSEIDKLVSRRPLRRKAFVDSVNNAAIIMAASSVVAFSILYDMGVSGSDPRFPVSVDGLNHTCVSPRTTAAIKKLLTTELRVSDDPERDALRMSELCMIIHAVLGSSMEEGGAEGENL